LSYLGGAAKMKPRAPSRSVRFTDIVRKIFEAGARSSHHLFQEFEHCFDPRSQFWSNHWSTTHATTYNSYNSCYGTVSGSETYNTLPQCNATRGGEIEATSVMEEGNANAHATFALTCFL